MCAAISPARCLCRCRTAAGETVTRCALCHGAPVQKVATMARHASIETTMIYFHKIDRLSDPAERYISYNGTAGDTGNA